VVSVHRALHVAGRAVRFLLEREAVTVPPLFHGRKPQADPERIAVSAVETALGRTLLVTSDAGALKTEWPWPASRDALAWARWRWPDAAVLTRSALHAEAARQLCAYFAGRLRRFDVPLDLSGSALHLAMWRAACEISYAEAVTYGELAVLAGAPGAARAAGRAMALCETPIFIPCQRVVGAGGKCCGELESWLRREQLLRMERNHARRTQ
jgi:O-6-methylguanine DNA methyltransferase